MSEQNASPGAVVITIREVWEQGQETRNQVGELATSVKELVAVNKRIDSQRTISNAHGERLRKLESQIAAQWVVVGIVITALGALLVKAITG